MQLWSYNHTTASSQRTPAGFRYSYGPVTTQQQAHKELLQDFPTINQVNQTLTKFTLGLVRSLCKNQIKFNSKFEPSDRRQPLASVLSHSTHTLSFGLWQTSTFG